VSISSEDADAGVAGVEDLADARAAFAGGVEEGR
jgi:hypothetical protein